MLYNKHTLPLSLQKILSISSINGRQHSSNLTITDVPIWYRVPLKSTQGTSKHVDTKSGWNTTFTSSQESLTSDTSSTRNLVLIPIKEQSLSYMYKPKNLSPFALASRYLRTYCTKKYAILKTNYNQNGIKVHTNFCN